MRRYANRYNRDMMAGSYEPPVYTPPTPPNTLDPKDERLIEAHLEIGRLQSANELIVEDNARLEEENRELKKTNSELKSSNESYREQAARERGASDLVNEIESELKNRKTTKKES